MPFFPFSRKKQKQMPIPQDDSAGSHNPGFSSPHPSEGGAGRHYVPDVPYLLPSDDEEIHRLDFQHYILRATLKANYMAPIQNPASLLDMGCGTGRWAAEMAQAFPHSSVVGFDLVSPTSTSSSIAFPSNCRFVQGNVLEGLPFAAQSFDYVHQCLLVFALPQNKWQQEVKELMRVTRPGGWVELVEVDIAFERMGPASAQLASWITHVSKTRGIDLSMPRKIGATLRSAGLLNITEKQIPNPIGDWGGRIGKMAAIGVQAVNRAMRQPVLTQLDISPARYDQTLATALEEYNQYRSFSNSYVAFGQHP